MVINDYISIPLGFLLFCYSNIFHPCMVILDFARVFEEVYSPPSSSLLYLYIVIYHTVVFSLLVRYALVSSRVDHQLLIL